MTSKVASWMKQLFDDLRQNYKAVDGTLNIFVLLGGQYLKFKSIFEAAKKTLS